MNVQTLCPLSGKEGQAKPMFSTSFGVLVRRAVPKLKPRTWVPPGHCCCIPEAGFPSRAALVRG